MRYPKAMNTFKYAFVALLLALAGCSPKADKSELSAGTIITVAELPIPGVNGDGPYALVKADALSGYYATYRSELFKLGVTKWDPRFDCNHFASYYVARMQLAYYLDNFHSTTKAQTLALAEVWYQIGGTGQGHAIVAAYTDKGLIFIEPQTGQSVNLTEAELKSITLCKW